MSGKMPKPTTLPLFAVPPGDEPARVRAATALRALYRSTGGAIDSISEGGTFWTLPHFYGDASGEAVRHGDICVAAHHDAASDTLQMLWLLAKASLPVGGATVCVVVDVAKASPDASPDAPPDAPLDAPPDAPPLVRLHGETVLVPDAAVLAVSHGANWGPPMPVCKKGDGSCVLCRENRAAPAPAS